MWPKKRRKQDNAAPAFEADTKEDSDPGGEGADTESYSTRKSGSFTKAQSKTRWPHRRGGRKVPASRFGRSDGAVEESDSQTDAETDAPVVTVAMVRERAMKLLARREHGRQELQEKLLQRELPADLISSVLQDLADEGLQCDTRFAESYTRMRVSRGYGANKVRADLQVRHIEKSVIDAAVRSREIDWGPVALAALEKKFAGADASSAENASKMQRHLYQRGFEMAEITFAIKGFSQIKA